MDPAGTLSIDGDRARLPSSVFEHAGFRAWALSGAIGEDLRASFVDGEVMIEMSPEATETHNKAKRTITSVLGDLCDREDLGEAYADGVLVTNEPARLSTEPDFVFVSWESFEKGRLTLVEKAQRSDDYIELEGTPDLVVEIVSDTSVRKDTQLLHDAYLRAGVREHWLIDARGHDISFQILQLRDGAYEPSAADGESQRSIVFARKFALLRSRNRAGRWRYALDVVT